MLFKKSLSNLQKRFLTGVVGVGFLLAISYFFDPDNTTWLVGLFFVLYSEMLIACYLSKQLFWKKSIVFVVWFLYLILGFYAISAIFMRGFLLEFCATIFAVDIAAFAVGKVVQGPKLAPTISPNKTISGFVGGLLAGSAAFYYLLTKFICPDENTLYILLIGAIFAIIVSLGDLFISIIKRVLKIKDTSNWLPGHGGFWDRCDSVFAGAIFLVIFVIIHSSLLIGN